MKLEVQTRIKSIRKSSTMFLMMLLLSYSKADELGFSFDSCPHGNGKLHQDPVVCLDVKYREGATSMDLDLTKLVVSIGGSDMED